jgi:hypothetical protein
MRRLILAVLTLAALAALPRAGWSQTSVFGLDHFALGATGRFTTREGDAAPAGLLKRGYEFSLPLAWNFLSPPEGAKGLRLSAFVAPIYGLDSKLTNSYGGWTLGLTTTIWEGYRK